MRALQIKREGKLRGIINWFGVHATSISSFNQRIHHDNKGVAAQLFEKNYPGTIAIFAQETAGDVSPNFIWDQKLKRMRGKFQDQYESAEFNGELQFREAEKVEYNLKIKGPLKSVHTYIDITEFTASPAHGVAFFEGTLEGPGVPKLAGKLLKGIARVHKTYQLLKDPHKHEKFYSEQAPKDILLDHRNGSFVGIPLSLWKKLPPVPEKTVEFFRRAAKSDSINTLPWVPAIIPFQIIFLGPLAIVGVPGEITTVAGEACERFDKIHLIRANKYEGSTPTYRGEGQTFL